MKKFNFRYDKLHRYQQQKQRLAEIEMMRHRRLYDEAVSSLAALRHQFQVAAAAFEQSLGRNPSSAEPAYAAIADLRERIADAEHHAKECREAWLQSAQVNLQETVRFESLDTLQRMDREHHLAELGRLESVDTQERLLNTWKQNQQEKTDG